MFDPLFNVRRAEGQSEEGHGNRMQAMRQLHDAGNGDQAMVWPLGPPRNSFSTRVQRRMQAKRVNRERCRQVGLDPNGTESNLRRCPLRLRGVAPAGTDLFVALTTFHHHDIKLSFANAHLHFRDFGE
jgi:hypothetical protein